MKSLFRAAVVLAALALGYLAGRTHARYEARAAALGHALESATLCANGLLAETKTSRILDHRLRSAIETAEALTRDGANIDIPIPNLLDGLRRAKVYAERAGDAQLSARIGALYERVAARKP